MGLSELPAVFSLVLDRGVIEVVVAAFASLGLGSNELLLAAGTRMELTCALAVVLRAAVVGRVGALVMVAVAALRDICKV